jgi:hypothetical protein
VVVGVFDELVEHPLELVPRGADVAHLALLQRRDDVAREIPGVC